MKLTPLPDRIWVLIAHEAGARIFFRDDSRLPLTLIDRIDWPIGRAKDRELSSDRPGHGETWAPSRQRHGFDQTLLPTEKNALDFASLLAHRVSRAADLDAFDHLFVVAAPKLLGLIRRDLGPPAVARLARELSENFGNIADSEIPARLAPLLADYELTKGLKKAG